MKLSELLKEADKKLLWGDREVEISSVAYDSRKVLPGSLFVCLKGFSFDGHRFLTDAVEKGASALVVEEGFAFSEEQKKAASVVTVVETPDSRKALAALSAAWFGYPAKQLTLIGITGTKGKTTTAHMIKKILEEAGQKVGMIGTLGAFIGEEKYPTHNTTPESYELHELFSKMKKAGCGYVVMEVSSQALKLSRTAGITFPYGIFLNISPDHIAPGEHADFEEYLACKKLLFTQTKTAIVNADDERWQEMAEAAKEVVTTSRTQQADFMGTNIQNTWEPGLLGVSFYLKGAMAQELEGEFSLNMPGTFNVENALIAIAVAKKLGICKEAVSRGLLQVSVKGRTQLLREASSRSTFLIDYAHNALSMESLLSMLKSYHPGRLICLFGCGGNRARQRRYDMGAMAGKYADLTILTTDNPRFEEVEDINADIIQGLLAYQGKYEVILDRAQAIRYLLDRCREDDIVVLIGKGHEEYQDIKGVKYAFSEEQVVKEYFLEHSL